MAQEMRADGRRAPMERLSKNRGLFRRRWQLALFMVVPFLWLVLFKYIPMIGIIMAFQDFKIRFGLLGSQFVGLQQFIKFFQSYQFERVMVNTVRLSLYRLITGFPLPLVLALFLNAMPNLRFKKLVQSITYVPHFISTVVLVGMIMTIFNPRVGLYGHIYLSLFGAYPSSLMGNPSSVVNLYVWSAVWQNVGWDSIIYIAALTAVSPELHEAAQLDGANRFQRCVHVDFPSILPIITILLILNTGSILGIGFEKIYLMQNPLNLSVTEVISTYVYKVSMSGTSFDLSYGTAIDLFNSLINLIMLVSVNWICRKVGETSLW